MPHAHTHPRNPQTYPQVYLLNVGLPLPDGREIVTEYNYVEERSQGDSVCYAHTCKQRTGDGHELEVGGWVGVVVVLCRLVRWGEIFVAFVVLGVCIMVKRVGDDRWRDRL
jgi:hypothetical protein